MNIALSLKKRLLWFGKTLVNVLGHPLLFFKQLSGHPAYSDALIFIGLVLVIEFVSSRGLDACGLLTNLPIPSGLNKRQEWVLNYLSVPITPLLLFGINRLFTRAGSFRSMVAVTAYASAYLVLPAISYAGFASAFYGAFLLYAGNKIAFALSVRKAVLIFGLFILTQFLLVGGLAFLLFSKTPV